MWDLRSSTRDQTWAPCSESPNHWTTREFPKLLVLIVVIDHPGLSLYVLEVWGFNKIRIKL